MYMNITEQEVNAIGSKRSRDEMNLKYMWHLRLDHIREEKISRLKKDGHLGPLVAESYSIYESYL